MKLCEFDKTDCDAHILVDKNTRSIEQRMDDIINRINKLKIDFSKFIISVKGRSILENDISNFAEEIENFYNFCNKCNDDPETRSYLDRLILINNELIDIFNRL